MLAKICPTLLQKKVAATSREKVQAEHFYNHNYYIQNITFKFSNSNKTNCHQCLHPGKDSLQIDQRSWITSFWLARFEDPLDVASDEWKEVEKEIGEQQRHQTTANNSCKIILQIREVYFDIQT